MAALVFEFVRYFDIEVFQIFRGEGKTFQLLAFF